MGIQIQVRLQEPVLRSLEIQIQIQDQIRRRLEIQVRHQKAVLRQLEIQDHLHLGLQMGVQVRQQGQEHQPVQIQMGLQVRDQVLLGVQVRLEDCQSRQEVQVRVEVLLEESYQMCQRLEKGQEHLR